MAPENNNTILDFDGTMTVMEAESAPFEAKFMAEFVQMTGLPAPEVQRIWALQKAAILREPEKFGWRNKKGLIAAPASADNYVLASVVAQELIRKLLYNPESIGIERSAVLKRKIPRKMVERNTLLDQAFMRSYAGLPTVLQPGAADFLSEVAAVSKVTIVGNAQREKLLEKLATLKDVPEVPVIGRAWKQEIEPEWDGVAKLMRIPGLRRRILLRRKLFHEALTQAGALEPGARSCAIGDIWELDLALPEHLGLNVGLMARDTTPGYELAHLGRLQTQGRAMLARTLGELLPQVLEFHSRQ